MPTERNRNELPKLTGVPAWAEALRQAAFDAVSASDVKAMFAKQVELAKDGNLPATKFISNFIMKNCPKEPD